MTNAVHVEGERLRRAGCVSEYTQAYEDAKKKVVRKERWSGRNWLRQFLCFLPFSAVVLTNNRWSIPGAYKIGLIVITLVICQGFWLHLFSRAVQKRLDAEMRTRAE